MASQETGRVCGGQAGRDRCVWRGHAPLATSASVMQAQLLRWKPSRLQRAFGEAGKAIALIGSGVEHLQKHHDTEAVASAI